MYCRCGAHLAQEIIAFLIISVTRAPALIFVPRRAAIIHVQVFFIVLIGWPFSESKLLVFLPGMALRAIPGTTRHHGQGKEVRGRLRHTHGVGREKTAPALDSLLESNLYGADVCDTGAPRVAVYETVPSTRHAFLNHLGLDSRVCGTVL